MADEIDFGGLVRELTRMLSLIPILKYPHRPELIAKGIKKLKLREPVFMLPATGIVRGLKDVVLTHDRSGRVRVFAPVACAGEKMEIQALPKVSRIFVSLDDEEKKMVAAVHDNDFWMAVRGTGTGIVDHPSSPFTTPIRVIDRKVTGVLATEIPTPHRKLRHLDFGPKYPRFCAMELPKKQERSALENALGKYSGFFEKRPRARRRR